MACHKVYYINFLLSILAVIFYSVKSANILCIPVQQGSHIEEMIGATKHLQMYGHTLYMVISSQYPNRGRFKVYDIEPVIYNMPHEEPIYTSEEVNKDILERALIDGDMNSANNRVVSLALRDCNYFMSDQHFLDNIKSLKIDIVVADGFMFIPCNLIVAKYLKVPFVSLSATYVPFLAHILDPVEVSTVESSNYNPTLRTRLQRTLVTFMSFYFGSFPAYRNISLLQKYAPEIPDWHTLHREALLFIVTRDYILEWPSVSTPNVIHLPGLSSSPAQKLDIQYDSIMTNAQNDVIVLSFGSMGGVLPRNILNTFLEAFSKLDYTVIMRCIPPKNINIPQNVKMFQWLPQNDLLSHSKTKLFLTHCGNGGQYEAVYHGVPMIGFPMFAEQHHNALRMVHKNIGIRLDIHKVTSDEIIKNVNEIMQNSTYKENVEFLSRILHDLPMDPSKSSAYWIDHVIKYGGKHLRYQALDMPWYEILMLDVLGVIVLVLVILILIVTKLIVCLYSNFVSIKNERQKENNKKCE